MMRTRPVSHMIAPLTLTLLLAIFTLACSLSALSPQETANQTAIAGIQASLDALNAGRTATADASNQYATALVRTATQKMVQARQAANLTATASSAAVTATASSVQGEANAPAGWRVAMYEPFEDNDNRWFVGKDDQNEFNHSDIEVQDHAYVWTATARQGFVSWGLSQSLGSFTDFYATVDGQLVSGEQSTAYGIVARESKRSFYVFEVNEQGGWAVEVLKDDIWNTLSSGRSGTIVTGGNHLAVKGAGTDFLFYVNNEQVAKVSDDRLSSGTIGLIIEMGFRGATSTISFDNFTVLTP